MNIKIRSEMQILAEVKEKEHPVAAVFPLLGGEDFEALLGDIREHGQLIAITVTEDGKILDGRNRYRACLTLGLVPTTVTYDGDDPVGFVLSTNLHRRHLGESQRAMIGARLAQLRPGRPAIGSIDPVTQSDAAKRLSVSTPSIKRARRVLEHGVPELVTAVDAGEVAVGAASLIVNSPEDEQREALERVQNGDARNLQVAARQIYEDRIREKAAAAAPPQGLVTDLKSVSGKYQTILLDPPWAYDDSGVRGGTMNHYSDMSLEDLATLPLGDLAQSDGAHLWIWTTFPMVREGAPQKLLDAWGYRWVGEIVWDKEVIGTGHTIRSQMELLILARKGDLPVLDSSQGSIYRERRSNKHSEKPEGLRKIVEELSPGPRIELFARCAADGWDRWGLEA